ncbi:MAG: HEAT repeat domain-containing protein, partial [Acidobacteriota bacterium]|nr:HEAT repeat domain-containing protein [Acidobacteriota bacterium]
RLQAEQEARARAEEEEQRLVAETRLRAEEEARRRAEIEARLKEEEARLQAEQEARARAEEEEQRLVAETRLRAEEEARRRAEVEARLKEEEARLQAEQEARVKAETEVRRLVEEARVKAEENALLLDESEARLKVEEARLRAEGEERLKEEQTRSDVEATATEYSSTEVLGALAKLDDREQLTNVPGVVGDPSKQIDEAAFAVSPGPAKEIEVLFAERGIASAEEEGSIPSEILSRLNSSETSEREAALAEIARVGGDDSFRSISRAFDDPSEQVRNAAARALFDLQPDRAATFTRALREGSPERRRKIGHALAASGLAVTAIANLTGESREKTYDAFSLLFLMAKAGEVQPLIQAIEEYPNVEVRIAVVKLLALSGQPEIVPAFRRLAVRGSLPSEVRSAVMEAIYQISSQAREASPSVA